jgi:hypothetical protein
VTGVGSASWNEAYEYARAQLGASDDEAQEYAQSILDELEQAEAVEPEPEGER